MPQRLVSWTIQISWREIQRLPWDGQRCKISWGAVKQQTAEQTYRLRHVCCKAAGSTVWGSLCACWLLWIFWSPHVNYVSFPPIPYNALLIHDLHICVAVPHCHCNSSAVPLVSRNGGGFQTFGDLLSNYCFKLRKTVNWAISKTNSKRICEELCSLHLSAAGTPLIACLCHHVDCRLAAARRMYSKKNKEQMPSEHCCMGYWKVGKPCTLWCACTSDPLQDHHAFAWDHPHSTVRAQTVIHFLFIKPQAHGEMIPVPKGRQEINELHACASMSARQQQTDIAGRLGQPLRTVQACWVMLVSSLWASISPRY